MSSERLSFCMVTTFYPPASFGGDGIYVQRLSRALVARGHEVTVVHSEDAYRALGGRAEPRAEDDGVVIHPLRRRFARGAALASYLTGRPAFYAGELEDVLARGRFDVVNFHNVSLVGGPGVLRYGDALKLYTTHEHWLVCPMHVLFRDNREPCVDPHCLRCSLRFHRPPQLWRYGGLLARSIPEVDLFLVPSQFSIDAHRARGFTAPMRRLPPFVPGAERQAAEHVSSSRPYFLFAGRLERLKGAHVLLDVFSRFRGADLLVAGEGSEAQELRRRAASLEHVRLLGGVDWQRLGALYSGAVALVIPSVGYETFGTVGAEAMAHGTPVIVNDLGGLPELAARSGGGIVYRGEAELVEAMRRLLTDPALRQELGERGRAAWRELWSEEAHLREYFAAIDEARALAA
ncbi:MAG TPA: glycosyltransferase [Gaiellaceae bacterium]|nr:glycosyltransferase [Gaiellaceae bacterium]